MSILRIFRRRKAEQAPPPAPGYVQPTSGYMPPEPPRIGIGSTIAKVLPIGRIIDQVASILRDPNGKLSSRRAGAGALVVAGIAFLGEGKHFEGIACLAFGTLLFALVKWTGHDPNA